MFDFKNSLTNFEQFLLSVLKKYNLENLYLQSNGSSNEESNNSPNDETNLDLIENNKNNLPNQWSKLSMMTKLDIIYNLCELRLQLPDIEQKITEFEASELRIEPLGLDSNGNKLWYFGDLRLYEEKPVIKEKTKKETTTANVNKKEEKKNNKKNDKKSVPKKQQTEKEKEIKRSTSLRTSRNVKQDEVTTIKSNKRKSDIIQQAPVVGLRRSSRRSMANIKFQEEVEEVEQEKIESENADDEEQEEEIEESIMKKDNESENVDIEENDEKITIKSENENETKIEPATIKTEEQIENKENIKTETAAEQSNDPNMISEQLFKPQKQPLVEELEIYKNELKYWSCVCLTLEDWNAINEKYKLSKKKIDQEISSLIEQNYLPEMPGLFQKAEKERMQRLLALAPKRQSQRLQSKQQQQKDYSENESSSHMNGNHLVDSDFDYDSDASKPNNNNNNNNGGNQQHIPLTEQERLKREEIAKQREERYRLRLQRLNGEHLLNNTDENSQSNSSYHSHHNNESDFNIKNYFLMHKGKQIFKFSDSFL